MWTHGKNSFQPFRFCTFIEFRGSVYSHRNPSFLDWSDSINFFSGLAQVRPYVEADPEPHAINDETFYYRSTFDIYSGEVQVSGQVILSTSESERFYLSEVIASRYMLLRRSLQSK